MRRSSQTDKARRKHHDLLERITIDRKVLTGKPTIRGMRISVEHILNLLGQGMTHSQILSEYPFLEEEDIRAALLCAREVMATEKVYKVEPAA